MNKLILCEGKTDAILLSYYLEKTCGWMHRKALKSLEIKADERKNESAYWYSKGEDNLLICGVGGKDNFHQFFQQKVQPAMIASSAFSKIAVVTDRDDRTVAAIKKSLRTALHPIVDHIKNNEWITNHYQNSFSQEMAVDFLLLIIPIEKEGALETLLLDSISENEYDKQIVQRSVAYVEDIQPLADRYIHKPRLKLKACLGVTWAIQSPEKVFSFIDEQIRSVKWEESEILAQCFQELKNI